MESPAVDLCKYSAGVPPTGVPNSIDPPTWEQAFIGTTAALMVWATVFLAGRLWINRRRLQLADGKRTLESPIFNVEILSRPW